MRRSHKPQKQIWSAVQLAGRFRERPTVDHSTEGSLSDESDVDHLERDGTRENIGTYLVMQFEERLDGESLEVHFIGDTGSFRVPKAARFGDYDPDFPTLGDEEGELWPRKQRRRHLH